MALFIAFVLALVATMALVPPLMHLAGQLRIVDVPDARKVHATAIPRVGGIAMVIGALLPIAIWAPLDREVLALLGGTLVLFVFGVWDDRGDLDFRLKFLGQVVAAGIVVFYGGIRLDVLPLLGPDPVPLYVSIPVSLVGIVGVTNAINLADGLDGLAAGTVLLSLAGIGYLAWLSDGGTVVLVTIVLAGVILGFLRYNTHPARVFMGDTGSQFLGFATCTLAIYLTQRVNTALNPAVALLLLGLPVFDTLYVMAKRAYDHRPLFVADNQHLHHKLLSLGFDHHEAVALIYVLQGLFVLVAVTLRYESDALLMGLYVGGCALLSLVLVRLGRAGWQYREAGRRSRLSVWMSHPVLERLLPGFAAYALQLSLGVFFLGGAWLGRMVTPDIGWIAALLSVALLARLVLGYRVWYLQLRLLLYVAAAIVLYLSHGALVALTEQANAWEAGFFGLLLAALVLSLRTGDREQFRVTPTDWLVVLLVAAVALVPEGVLVAADVKWLILKLVVLFYAVEVAMRQMVARWNLFTVPALVALLLIAARGLGIV